MAKSKPVAGIFGGMDKIISSFFGLRDHQTLKHRAVSRRLNNPENRDFSTLIFDLYACIEANHIGRQPSRQNWRSERVTTLSDQNKSPEVLLERAVAMLSESDTLPDWLNQVPVASGFVDDRTDKRAAIDLVKLENGTAKFVELKWASDTPAYAAFEVLRYGLVYLFSRVNAEKLGYADQQLMRVAHVDLQVVAPAVFFDKHDLGWLERGLDKAVQGFSRKMTEDQLAMRFKFLAMPSSFQLPFCNGSEVRAMCEKDNASAGARQVCDAFNSLTPVWPR